jgi:predicted transcriptional regulator
MMNLEQYQRGVFDERDRCVALIGLEIATNDNDPIVLGMLNGLLYRIASGTQPEALGEASVDGAEDRGE